MTSQGLHLGAAGGERRGGPFVSAARQAVCQSPGPFAPLVMIIYVAKQMSHGAFDFCQLIMCLIVALNVPLIAAVYPTVYTLS